MRIIILWLLSLVGLGVFGCSNTTHVYLYGRYLDDVESNKVSISLKEERKKKDTHDKNDQFSGLNYT
jgi:hypothetical protein